jgi:TM2 domain-containing membrane protein YozV
MKIRLLLVILGFFFVSQVGFSSFPTEKKEITEKVDKSNATSKELKKLKEADSKKVTVEETPYTSPASGKSQLIALILAFVVGVLGVHRFYLGYTTIGIIQLLTLGGCGVWTLIDLIRIITGDLKPKDGDYTEKL